MQKRIQKAFRKIHTDLSSREELDENAGSIPNDTTEKRVTACISAALRSPHIAERIPLRTNVHGSLHCRGTH